MADLLATQHCKLPNLSHNNTIAILSKLFVSGDMSYFPMVVLALQDIIDLPRARVHLTNICFFNLIMVVLEECRTHHTIIALETLVRSTQMS